MAFWLLLKIGHKKRRGEKEGKVGDDEERREGKKGRKKAIVLTAVKITFTALQTDMTMYPTARILPSTPRRASALSGPDT